MSNWSRMTQYPSTHRLPIKYALFCAASLALVIGTPASARIAVNVTRVGFPSLRTGDIVRNGAWAPVIVDLDLLDSPSFDGSLRIAQYDNDGDQCYDGVDVHLMADTSPSRRYFLYIPTNQQRARDSFSVEVIDAEGQVVEVVSQGELSLFAKPSQIPTTIEPDDIVVLSLSSGAIGRVRDLVDPGLKERYTRSIRVAHMSPTDMPELWIGLEAVDFIVWDDARPDELTQRQLDSLILWVRHGGTLLIAASRTAGAIQLSKTLYELLPVTLGELVTAPTLRDVRYQLVGAPLVDEDDPRPPTVWEPPPFPSPIPVIRCNVKNDRYRIAAESAIDSVVVSQRPLGRGWIIFSGVTIGDLFSGEGNSVEFFRRLFVFSEIENEDEPLAQPISLFPHVAASISFHRRASTYLFVAGISSVVYVLLATFGLWAFLGARQWRKHAWSAFAVVAIAASLLSIVLVNSLRGFTDQLHQLSIVDAAAGDSRGTATVLFGLKTHIDREVDVWLPSDAMSADTPVAGNCFLRPIPVGQGPGEATSSFTDPVEYKLMPAAAVIDQVRIRATLKQFEGRWSGRLGGRLDAKIFVKGQTITDDSFVVNNLGVDLHRCMLLQTLIDVNESGTTRPNGIVAYDLGPLPADGQAVTIADRCYPADRLANDDAVAARPWLSNRQKDWHGEFQGLASSMTFGTNPVSVTLGKEESALMLITTLGDFDPPAASGLLGFARTTWSRDRLRALGLRRHLKRDTVILIGFADDPGPARLFYRSGDERFAMVDPEPGHAKTMYRFTIPVEVVGGRTVTETDEEDKKRVAQPER